MCRGLKCPYHKSWDSRIVSKQPNGRASGSLTRLACRVEDRRRTTGFHPRRGAHPMPKEIPTTSTPPQTTSDGRPNDEAATREPFEGIDSLLDILAAGFYSFASMLVGEGEDSVGLAEKAFATAELSASSTVEEARRSGQLT